VAGKARVLLTGASGYIASQLLPEFRNRYELRMVDVRDTGRAGKKVAGVQVADLASPDRTAYERLFDGIDTVVHLGYRHPGRPGDWGESVPPVDRFDIEFTNVQMAQNVYRCAFDAGVRRVVMASSNHAADWYEHAFIHARKKEIVSPDELPLSDNFYGWAKAAYELLGFVYACGSLGRKLEVVQVRIGAPREVLANTYLDGSARSGAGDSGLVNYKRDLGAHISERDICQLFVRSIETPDIANAYGVPWLVVYGISGNTRVFWSLESARRVLGYAPEDDTEVKYAAGIHRVLTGAGDYPVLVTEDGGRRIRTEFGERWKESVAAAVRGLRIALARLDPRIVVESWNGEPAAGSDGAEALRDSGFRRDYPGMVFDQLQARLEGLHQTRPA
jgi:uronate dehydrogenase/NAD+ dependent glucose-6-phosphate dehydrogenase